MLILKNIKIKIKKEKKEEEVNLGLMIAPKFFESQNQNFCHVIKPLTCSLPLMHWWLLQNSWFFYVWCSLYDFGSLWVSFQNCPLACQLPSHFLVNFLLKASHSYLFTSLPLLGFVGKHSWCTNPFYYVILQAFSTHLVPFYLFYSHGLFAKSFGLPKPNYHIFTSYYYLGLLAFGPTHWVA